MALAPSGKINVKKTEEMVLRYQKMDPTRVEAKKLLEEIVLRQSRLAYSLTIKHRKRFKDRDQDDLLMVALAKVQRAVELFKPDQGANFNTYCAIWMEAGIKRELQNEFWQAGLIDGTKYRQLFGRLPRVMRSLERSHQDMDGHFSPSQIALEYNRLFSPAAEGMLNEAEVEEFLVSLQAIQTKSLDAPLPSDGSRTLKEVVESKSDTPRNMEYAAESIRIGRYLSEFMERLNPNEKVVFEKRLLPELDLFPGSQSLSLKEIGDSLGFSRERARQIQVNVVRKFAWFMKGKGLRPHNPKTQIPEE